MCEEMNIARPCKACKPALMKLKERDPDDWDQDEHDIVIDKAEFRLSLFKSLNQKGFRCPQCGWKSEATVNDHDGNDWYCRCFRATIAGRKITFCALALLCDNCFHVEYYRPSVEWECTLGEKEFRIYPPINNVCENATYPILSAQKERMRQWQLQAHRLQNRLLKQKKG